MTASGQSAVSWALQSSYATLPSIFYCHVVPRRPRDPAVFYVNEAVCELLGLDAEPLRGQEGAEVLGGVRLPEGSRPLAQAYAGHQFGRFAVLGDGRALLLGERVTADGRRYDVQLKGSGPTPYSRGGDGLAALGPMLREVLISEAMHGLGIPTTRGLAVVTTGDRVQRATSLPGAVLARVASSHLRVGTFEFAAAVGDREALQALVDYALQRHVLPAGEGLPPASSATPDRALLLLRHVARRQAELVARWQSVGFVHGVMNTDNVSIAGETIDYGPCAFLDAYHPATVFSSIDQGGRYAFGRQPGIMLWNLERLAVCLLPLLGDSGDDERAREAARTVLQDAAAQYEREWLRLMCAKLGLSQVTDQSSQMVIELLNHMARSGADYTNVFLGLTESAAAVALPGDRASGEGRSEHQSLPLCAEREALFGDGAFALWRQRWEEQLIAQCAATEDPGQRLPWLEAMERANPQVIPRNHLVEEVLQAAVLGDRGPFDEAMRVLRRPFDRGHPRRWQHPAPAGSPPHRTFCGT